ncbi:hypothetical protein FA15DRAFT_705725 [Coprinopsis marcescibilis]|uniref:Uncharacterized protein n=1 Tax=Coprinopsis marcescibilis TaxID=230819 RepID=A0A5C3L4M8_COPMA|nr:hypothetical protein FA15DRAFT_705725 [Coprinopsis marcescibilis]
MYNGTTVLVVQEPEQHSPTNGYFDMDLCGLLETMNLGEKQVAGAYAVGRPEKADHEDLMMEDLLYQESDEGSECSESSLSTGQEETPAYYGCAYLQAIRSQIEEFQTTSGEYVETIFTHREMFYAHPSAHRDCARGFSDIAYILEKRAWRADRESDMEAVSTFRHEAWMVANSL